MNVLLLVYVAYACSLVPGFYSILSTDTPLSRLEGFVIARPVQLTVDSSSHQWRNLTIAIDQWIGPNRSDTVLTIRHYGYQTALVSTPGLGPDCSEVIAKSYVYLIPLYWRSKNGDSLLYLQFPRYTEVLGRSPVVDSPSYSSTKMNLLKYFYDNRRSAYEVSVGKVDSFYRRPFPTNVKLTISNASSFALPFPRQHTFDLHVKAYRGQDQLYYLYQKEDDYKPYMLDADEPVDSIPPYGTVERIIDLNSFYESLKDSLPLSSTHLVVFARVHMGFVASYGSVIGGLSSSSDTLTLLIDQPNSTKQNDIVTSYFLNQNYPNPFNPSTTISYDVPTRAHVTLKIFNVLGQEMATLVNGEVEAGRHRVQWEATGLPSGVYIYMLEANDFVETKKMVLVR